MPKPVINKDLCSGCGACPELCPEVFAMFDDEKAQVIGPDKCSTCDCETAADSCPEGAITLQ